VDLANDAGRRAQRLASGALYLATGTDQIDMLAGLEER
jgi:hypothetical protein